MRDYFEGFGHLSNTFIVRVTSLIPGFISPYFKPTDTPLLSFMRDCFEFFGHFSQLDNKNNLNQPGVTPERGESSFQSGKTILS